MQLTDQAGSFKRDDTLVILNDRVEVLTATVQKAVDSLEAPSYFAENTEGSSSDPLDPLASIPNSNGVQTSIGSTSADFATAVTIWNTNSSFRLCLQQHRHLHNH